MGQLVVWEPFPYLSGIGVSGYTLEPVATPLLLGVTGLTKSFGVQTLFEDVSFVVEENERVGLIGPNGAGKSTLLRILAGLEKPDAGQLSSRRGLTIGYLAQMPEVPMDSTVEEAVHEAAGDDLAIVGEILSRLELAEIGSRIVGELSGGWRKRVALARELVKAPEILLLDEPTNHLDVESILWLESFLQRASFSVVVVTHDRAFLARTTNRILELNRQNPGGLLSVRGGYREYLEQKSDLLSAQRKEESSLKNKLRRETEWLLQGAKARTTKQQARIKAAGELKEKVEDVSSRLEHRSVRLAFETTDKQPKRLLEAKQVGKSLGGRKLFQGLDVFLGPCDRIGLLGKNGSGKSTLIRVLLGTEKPDTGTVYQSEHLRVAYFEQERDTLDGSLTLRKTLCPAGDQVNFRGTLVHVNGYLDRFLFRREQADMPVRNLSGGEQSRLLIARLMLREANLLVLDEPTNDLDAATLDVLEDCLIGFEGAVLLVTHDRYFLDQTATQILAFPSTPEENGKVVEFADLKQWENWRLERSTRAKESRREEATAAKEVKKKKLTFNEERELAGMEAAIAKAEQTLAKASEEAQDPQHASNVKKVTELYATMSEAQSTIDKLYARWTELEGRKNSL